MCFSGSLTAIREQQQGEWDRSFANWAYILLFPIRDKLIECSWFEHIPRQYVCTCHTQKKQKFQTELSSSPHKQWSMQWCENISSKVSSEKRGGANQLQKLFQAHTLRALCPSLDTVVSTWWLLLALQDLLLQSPHHTPSPLLLLLLLLVCCCHSLMHILELASKSSLHAKLLQGPMKWSFFPLNLTRFWQHAAADSRYLVCRGGSCSPMLSPADNLLSRFVYNLSIWVWNAYSSSSIYIATTQKPDALQTSFPSRRTRTMQNVCVCHRDD